MDFLIKEIVDHGVPVTIQKDLDDNYYYYQIETGAKSNMHLYIDEPNTKYRIKRRYKEQDSLERETWDKTGKNLILDFLYSFKSCLHGRDYCNEDLLSWAVDYGVIAVKTTTKTTRELL